MKTKFIQLLSFCISIYQSDFLQASVKKPIRTGHENEKIERDGPRLISVC